MDLPINHNRPLIMHIDLNSAYAMIEQQANPLIRNKPVAIAAYDTPRGMIIAASYEAKRKGIQLGVNVQEARLIDKDVIILMPDPEKYFDAHRRFKKVLLKYTSSVVPKSIDEFVVEFGGSGAIRSGKSLEEVGVQIKRDIKNELGEYVTVNIGIATNRFLAKVAAGLNKPDGLDVITGKNLRDIYARLELIDLPGINTRFQARLNMQGIQTPLQFLDAPMFQLKDHVFHSIVGLYWYLQLRGYPLVKEDFDIKSFGNQYALSDKTTDKEKISRLLMKLCEKTGRRIRKHDYFAGGVHLSLMFANRTYWAKGRKTKSIVYSTQDIYRNALLLLNEVKIPAKVTHLGITVYNLQQATPVQMGLFDDSRLDSRSLAIASDKINDRYGEFTVVPAIMANMQNEILKQVPFGSVRDI